jgi:hypothetical protein
MPESAVAEVSRGLDVYIRKLMQLGTPEPILCRHVSSHGGSS